MPRLTLLALWAWLVLLGLAAAQNSRDGRPLDGYPLDRPDLALPPPPLPPHPLPRDPELPPPPMALPPADGAWQYVPPGPTAPAPVEPAQDGASDERAGHLLQAAEHLEAAGLAEQAARLRQQAREQSMATLLARKLAELKKLQAEIEQLRQAAGTDRCVALQVKIAEVSRKKANELSGYIVNPNGAAALLARYTATAHNRATVPLVVENDFLPGLHGDGSALEEALAMSVLSKPRITTLSGQPAKCVVGRIQPLAVAAGKDQIAMEVKHLGVSLEITPHVLNEKCLRLEVRCRTDELDSSRDRMIGKQTVPGMRIREVDAAVEMTLGQTAVVACIEEGEKPASDVRRTSTTGKERETDDKVTLVFVTPTLIGERIDRAPLPSPVAEKPGTSWWGRWWRQ